METKSLQKRIMEGIVPELGRILDEGLAAPVFTDADLEDDYNALDMATMKEKQAMAAKYGIESRKADDIRLAIAKEWRKNRASKTEFTDDDFRHFRKLNPSDVYKKLVAFLDAEPRAFVEYLRDVYYENVKKRRLERFAKPGIPMDGYNTTANDRWIVNRYRNVVQYLTEKSDSFMQELEAISILNDMLLEHTADFREYIIKETEENARKYYRELPEKIERLRAIADELEKELSGLNWSDRRYHEVYRQMRKRSSEINKCESILEDTTEQEYVDMEKEEADEYYHETIKSLAERLKEKDIDVPNAVITDISRDPKLFEIHIQDGKQRLYARSILAAVESSYMRMHWRFIITNERKLK